MAAGDTSKRFNDLGHRMMCTCGCNQILLECNHVGCTKSDTMRAELAAGLDNGDNDSMVLQNFVQKYGNTVIAAPAQSGFGLVAWITPFAALAAATWLVVVVVRRWQRRPAMAMAGAPVDLIGAQEVDALRARARQETEQ
jgi:cytochrome c-type biogenesis protein CcmH